MHFNRKPTTHQPYRINYCPWRERLKRVLIIFGIIAVGIAYLGLPYIRWNYRYIGRSDNKYVTEAIYWNGIDKFHATPHSLGHDCHGVILVPIEDRLPQISEKAISLYQNLKRRVYGAFK